MGTVMEFPATVRVRCPDCSGRGCERRGDSGQWRHATADRVAGLAGILAPAGQLERAEYYRRKARELPQDGPACPRCGESCRRARTVPAWGCPACGHLWRPRHPEAAGERGRRACRGPNSTI